MIDIIFMGLGAAVCILGIVITNREITRNRTVAAAAVVRAALVSARDGAFGTALVNARDGASCVFEGEVGRLVHLRSPLQPPCACPLQSTVAPKGHASSSRAPNDD